jgi:ribosomal protein S12 methylthiotransferase accessory factor
MTGRTAPWAHSCDQLARSIASELPCHLGADSDYEVAVAGLGVRDELADRSVNEGTRGNVGAIPVHLDGQFAIVGPIRSEGFPGTGCARCLARRWQLVRSAQRRDALELGGPTGAVGEPPYLTPFATTALAAMIGAHLARTSEPGGNEGAHPLVYVVDLTSAQTHRMRLLPDADCPQCGQPASDTPELASIALAPSPKRTPSDFRLRALADIDLPMDALLNPACGALSSSSIAELDLPTTSAVLGSFAARSEEDLYEIFWAGHANNFQASLRIGVIEGLERYAGMRPRSRRVATWASLIELGDSALDPRECGLYSDEFYATDPEALPFSPERQISWVWGYSLRDSRPILVPESLTYYHSVPQAERFVQECSNGCASGSSLAEAIYFGLAELIERDAFLLAWYGRAVLPEIDPQTSARSETREMVDRLAMYGYHARFFDARITFPVPVVVATAQRLDGGLGALCFGAGASLDPEAALAASLVEIATDSLHLRRRTERDEARLRSMAADFDKVLGLSDHPILYGLPEMSRHADFLLGPRPAGQDLPVTVESIAPASTPGNTDLGDDLRLCVESVADAGFDVIVVDQSTPEQRGLGLHTASVLVPGLVPIDFGWRRQRALLMPRMRTALSAELRQITSTGLNPAPHPFP